jgi:hypothetical protein
MPFPPVNVSTSHWLMDVNTEIDYFLREICMLHAHLEINDMQFVQSYANDSCTYYLVMYRILEDLSCSATV